MRGVSAQTVVLDEEELNGSGYVLRARAGYARAAGIGDFGLRASTSYYGYVEEDRRDRWSNELFADFERSLSDAVTLDLTVGGSTNTATLEGVRADQGTARTQLTYQPSRANRYRIYGAYRYRSYQGDGGEWAHAPYIGATYRRRLDRYQYVDLGASYERTDATIDRRDYQRVQGTAFYTHPLSARSRLRVGATARTWEYPHRLVGAASERRDWSLSPQANFSYDFRSPWRADVELRWTDRNSNAPEIERAGHRAALTLRYVL